MALPCFLSSASMMTLPCERSKLLLWESIIFRPGYFAMPSAKALRRSFAGSEPVIATSGKYKGTVILQEEQDKGFAMFQGLTETQRKKAVLSFSKTGNNNLTEAFKDNVVLDYAGVRVSDLSAARTLI